jgi:hypothetical protein
MVPFDRSPSGKKLPGKHGQQDHSAALSNLRHNIQPIETKKIFRLARLSL